MATIVIKKAIATEKSYHNEDKAKAYTFLVDAQSNKSEIKTAVEELFGVKVDKVTTSAVRSKTRRLRRHDYTKRRNGKIARVTLKDKVKLDLTKLAA